MMLVPPDQNARVLERDRHACSICHTIEGELFADYIVPLRDGANAGVSTRDLYSDSNCITSCKPCRDRRHGGPLDPAITLRVLQERLGR